MTKILLVEDDTSLREIYGVRLLAEGYDIVTADNGEIALAMAIKERPALIITDVMMPKISGFDMLDILRSTTETKDIKVIMMTALGSEENKDRGERLGADRYLVKSQVGIEDVVHTVHDLLQDQPSPTGMPAVPAPGAPAVSSVSRPPIPAAIRGSQATADFSRTMVSTPPVAQPGAPANQANPAPAVTDPTLIPNTPPPATSVTSSQTSTTGEPPSRRARVIQPINDPNKKVDIQALLDRELAKEAGAAPAQSTEQEREVVNEQLEDFASKPAPTTADSAPTPAAASSPSPATPTPAPAAPTPAPPVPPAAPSTTINVDESGNIAPATPKPAAPPSSPASPSLPSVTSPAAPNTAPTARPATPVASTPTPPPTAPTA